MRRFKIWLTVKLLRVTDRWMKTMTNDERLDVVLRRKEIDVDKWKKLALSPLHSAFLDRKLNQLSDVPDDVRLGEKDLHRQEYLKNIEIQDGPWSNTKKS